MTDSTIVIVHGGWSGGWIFKDLERELRPLGHEVYRVTLTGMGERSHLMNASIDLDVHIQDVVNVLEYEDLTDIVLVGHSYGGFVISGTAARAGRRIGHLVYLDAFVPADGQAAINFGPPEMLQGVIAQQSATPGLVPFRGQAAARGGAGPIDFSKTGAQPLLTMLQGVKLGGEEALVAKRTFIHADRTTPSPFAGFYERFKDDPAWSVRTIHTGHIIVDEDVPGLARMLDEVARS